MSYARLPKILVVQLKRMKVSEGRRVKIHKAINAKAQLLTPELTSQMMREMKKLCRRDLTNAMI